MVNLFNIRPLTSESARELGGKKIPFVPYRSTLPTCLACFVFNGFFCCKAKLFDVPSSVLAGDRFQLGGFKMPTFPGKSGSCLICLDGARLEKVLNILYYLFCVTSSCTKM